MLRLALLSIAALAALIAPSFADQSPQPVSHQPITVTARRVVYFSDRSAVQARGDVRVSLPDGTVVEGDAFSMDLQLSRVLVAGHVRFTTPAGTFSGAALADFLAFRREYFLPLDPLADRWTFVDGDFAHPEKGREMPGDAFFLPDFSDSRPYVVAKSIVIDPSGSVKFRPATISLLGGPYTPPLPSYVYDFSANSDFGVNSLSGATFDAPLNFAGSPESLDTLHFRYDQNAPVHGYLSLEHHSVFNGGGYAVFSLNPATQPNKQWNLLAYQPTGADTALNLESQLFTYQDDLSQPLSANGFADLQLIHGFAESSARVEYAAQYGNLLGPNALGYYGNPTHAYVSNHPTTLGIEWTGFDHPLIGDKLMYRLQSGIGADHDSLGVDGTAMTDIWTQYLDGLVYTSVLPGPFNTNVTASYDARRIWLGFPNTVNSETLTLTDSRRVSGRFFVIGSIVDATVSTRDLKLTVVSPNASLGLTPQPLSTDGIPLVGGVGIYPNETAANNVAYALTGSFQPVPNFQVAASVQENAYAPGQSPNGIGPPRYQFSADVRTKITKTLFLDVSRSYSFNWAGLGWSPRFTFQVTAP